MCQGDIVASYQEVRKRGTTDIPWMSRSVRRIVEHEGGSANAVDVDNATSRARAVASVTNAGKLNLVSCVNGLRRTARRRA